MVETPTAANFFINLRLSVTLVTVSVGNTDVHVEVEVLVSQETAIIRPMSKYPR